VKIICHRGYWKKTSDQNSLPSCLLGLDKFDGIEIDLKNNRGEIVLSHDPLAPKQRPIALRDIFAKNTKGFYALNIKEDGLGPGLKDLISRYGISNYMCFDLSSPEEVKYRSLGLTAFKRFGDHDPLPKAIKSGIVVDVFNEQKYSSIINQLPSISKNYPLFFISPELHHHPVEKTWTKIKKLIQSKNYQAYLCTDLPQEAAVFFS
jgi:glycerophosphoryl diester phosphodiesterase